MSNSYWFSCWICVLSFFPSFVVAQDGFTQFFYPDGSVSSEGEMLNGEPVGVWRTYHTSGLIKSEGRRVEGLLDSIWTFYNNAGQLQRRISYERSLRNGKEWTYQAGQLLQACDFIRDTLEGICEAYKDGRLWKTIPYQDGLEEGKGYELDSLGTIITIMHYKDGFLRRTERQNRKDKQGRKQGIWRTYHDNDVLASEATYVDDRRNGLYKEYDRKGDLKVLEKYDDGLLVTDAEETAVLDIKNEYSSDGRITGTGSYREGKKHGVHRSYDQSGSVVASTVYQMGVKTAEGSISASGKYEGEWTLFYTDGSVKEQGSYVEGMREGDWEFFYENGKLRQKGKYRQGKPHGRWEWFYKNGERRREEEYRRGREDGESKEFDPSGRVIAQGLYVDGLKDGLWEYRIGDYWIKGAYIEGKKDGSWSGVYDNGKKKFTGAFQAGYAIKKHRYFFRNGQLAQEGKYSSGRKDGEWRRFDEDGEIILRTLYDQGIERRLEGTRISPTYEELDID